MRLVQLTAAGLVAAGAVEGARRGPCKEFRVGTVEYTNCRLNHLEKKNNNNNSNSNPNNMATGFMSHIRPNPGFFGSNGPWNGNQHRPNPFFDQIMNDREMNELGTVENSEEDSNSQSVFSQDSFKRSASSSKNSQDPACSDTPFVRGLCRALVPRWTYDAESNECKSFGYGGCGGNSNNFVSQDECERKCFNLVDGPQVTIKSALSNGNKQKHSGTKKASNTHYGNNQGRFSNFNRNGWNFGFASDMTVPVSNKNGKHNPCDDKPITEPGFCRALVITYTYDKPNGKCVQAAFGGCAHGTTNSFETMELCEKECANKNEAQQGYTLDEMMQMTEMQAQNLAVSYDNAISKTTCSKENPCGCPKNIGLSMGKKSKNWYYNDQTGQCETFIYRGFMGNYNRFNSECECMDKCSNPEFSSKNACSEEYYQEHGYPEIAVRAAPNKCFERMAEMGFCRALIQVYSFNSETGECERRINGGCDIGTKNFFSSERECNSECANKDGGSESTQEDDTQNDGIPARCLGSFEEPDLSDYYGATYGYLVYDQDKGKCRKVFYKEPVDSEDLHDKTKNLFQSFPKCREACQSDFVRSG